MPDPLELRIGIESGEAATGTGPEDQVLVTGSVVNTAARSAGRGGAGRGARRRDDACTCRNGGVVRDGATDRGEGIRRAARGFDGRGAQHAVARRTIPFVGGWTSRRSLRQAFSRVIATVAPLLFTIGGRAGHREVAARSRVPRWARPGGRRARSGGAISVRTAPRSRRRPRWFARSPVSRTTTPIEVATERLRELIGRVCVPGDRAHVRATAGARGLSGPTPRRVRVRPRRPVRLPGSARGARRAATGHAGVRGRADAAAADARPDRADRRARTAGPGRVLVVVAARRAARRAARAGARGRQSGRASASSRCPRSKLPTSRDRREGTVSASDRPRRSSRRAGGNPFFIVESTGMLLGKEPSPRRRASDPADRAGDGRRASGRPAPRAARPRPAARPSSSTTSTWKRSRSSPTRAKPTSRS